MPRNENKRCPQCGGTIDMFGSCRRCGREWTAKLEEDELAEGLPEGQQHESEVKPKKKKSPKNRWTKSSAPRSEDKWALWRIDDKDNETEIINKRSLMHLESRKVYNTMGLSLRAHEASKASLLWIAKLWELLSEEERAAISPAIEHLKRGYADIKVVAQAKVNEAAKMEIEVEKELKAARKQRIKLLAAEAKRKKDAATKQIEPGKDTEGMNVPDLATIDPKDLETLSPDDLLELAKAKLSNLDQEKALRKRTDLTADENTPED